MVDRIRSRRRLTNTLPSLAHHHFPSRRAGGSVFTRHRSGGMAALDISVRSRDKSRIVGKPETIHKRASGYDLELHPSRWCIRFQTDVIIYSVSEPLLAPEVSLGCLDRNVA